MTELLRSLNITKLSTDKQESLLKVCHMISRLEDTEYFDHIINYDELDILIVHLTCLIETNKI